MSGFYNGNIVGDTHDFSRVTYTLSPLWYTPRGRQVYCVVTHELGKFIYRIYVYICMYKSRQRELYPFNARRVSYPTRSVYSTTSRFTIMEMLIFMSDLLKYSGVYIHSSKIYICIIISIILYFYFICKFIVMYV